MKSYLGKPELKEAMLAEMKKHQEADAIIKARISQAVVIDFLKNNNFEVAEVSHPNANGIDIVAIKNGRSFSFEVKSVIKTTRMWRINKLTNTKSDYIAVVMPSGRIWFETTEDWQKCCNDSGSRSITKLVNLDLKLLKEAK